MNIKKTVVAVSSLLYGYGVAATASELSPSELRPINLKAMYEIQKEIASNTTNNNYTPLRSGAMTNIHFNPTKPKIVLEENLTGTNTYIVRLQDHPVATYEGGIPGLNATSAKAKANKGKGKGKRKLYKASKPKGASQEDIDAYSDYLTKKQEKFLAKAKGKGYQAKVNRTFQTALNAISMELTQQEAAELAQFSEVAYVQRSRAYELHTDVGPEHIGANKVWQGETTVPGQFDGEGMIVGIIDTGINTQHPSFAAIDGNNEAHTNPLGAGNYLGDCALEEYADRCNDKLIGVYTHPTITDEYYNEEGEQLAPAFGEDFHGHGSHVASTVAGNVMYNVDEVAMELGGGHGTPIGVQMPKVSGVAPRANIISYQVCLPVGGCTGEAMLFAIEQAIKDGVDVINMSIGSYEHFPWDDAFEMAFLSAREAGVAVALSAGNSGQVFGPDSLYTVDHTSPWVLNVAATTHARSIVIEGKELTGFSGGDESLVPNTLEGAGISDSFTGELVLAADYGDARCNEPFAAGTFNSEQIVICERGDIARVTKASNVQAGGAGAFILYNTYNEGDQISDDAYVIPGIHITQTQWDGPSWRLKALKPWLESNSEKKFATITASEVSRQIDPENADWLADFSSRGPSTTIEELFTPGIAAPGVDIFAAWTEENPFDPTGDTRDWSRISGTSMASPHVAGAMTLVSQAQPDWTAAEIQSALQMTADSKAIKMQHPRYDEVVIAGPYRAGHGLVNVARAIDAGLIMDETADNFLKANPQQGGQVRELNLPQVINRNCGQVCTWTRTVKATKDGTWNVNVEKLEMNQLTHDWTLDPTSKLEVIPSSFTLKAGESITLTIKSSFEEADMAWYDGTVQMNEGEIQFISEDSSIPMSIWPYASQFQGKLLPDTINVVANDDRASMVVPEVPFGVPSAAVEAVAFEPKELTDTEVVLPRMGFGVTLVDDSGYFNIVDDPENGTVNHDWIQTIPVKVSDNAAILTAELTGVISSTSDDFDLNNYINADLYIAKDFNGDGKIHYSEAICGSLLEQTTKGEFCTLENPEAGDYTIIVASGYVLFPWDSVDTIGLSYGVVNKTPSKDLQLSFTPSVENELNSDMTINWKANLKPGATYHSAIEVKGGSEGKLALIPVKIKRGTDTLTVSTSQTEVQAGDIIDLSVVIQANRSGTDRNIDLDAKIGKGLKVVPGSISMIDGLTETNDGFKLTLSQENSANWDTNYVITTNQNDMMCRTPGNLPEAKGGYVDLAKYGIQPTWGSMFEVNEWGWGNWIHDIIVPVSTENSNSLTAFGNEDYFQTSNIVVSSKGFLQLDAGNYNSWDIMPHQIHIELPAEGYSTPPDFIFASLWNASLDMFWNQSFTLSMYDPEEGKGVSMATLGDYIVVEWDKATTYDEGYDMFWNREYTPRDDSYDHQMFLNTTTSYTPGEYEVVMAYDNVNFGTQEGLGSIGVRGYHGPRNGFNPLYGHTGVSLAFNDLNEVVKDDLVVCYDVVGPESTRITVNFKAEITKNANGSVQAIHVQGDIDGVSKTKAKAFINVTKSKGKN